MRDVFHEELNRTTDYLVEMTRLAGSAMSRATTALLDSDVHLAESVITADKELDSLREQLDQLSIDLIARQQPVATDLRIVVTSMRMSSDLERMGDLARHIAKVARLRYPECAVPPAMHAHILEMGQVAGRIVTKAGAIIASNDVAAAVALDRDDDQMDALHRQLFVAVHSMSLPTQAIVDLTLLGRYYERFADHAVSVARRVVYLVTGAYLSEHEIDRESEEDGWAAREIASAMEDIDRARQPGEGTPEDPPG